VRVDTALVCDAVSVREGLLNVLGGGVTRLNPPTYPHAFQGALALRLIAHPTEAATPHGFRIVLQTEDGKRLVEIGGDMETQPADNLEPGEELAIPLGLNFNVSVPSPGGYSFEVLIDGIHQTTLPFRAMPTPNRGEGADEANHE
jgi:hypothetical protein